MPTGSMRMSCRWPSWTSILFPEATAWSFQEDTFHGGTTYTEEEVESLFRVARTVADKIMKAYSPDFVAMYARGRRIPHTHIFLVPTYKGDPLDRFFNALEGFQEAPPALMMLRDKSSMQETAERLRSS